MGMFEHINGQALSAHEKADAIVEILEDVRGLLEIAKDERENSPTTWASRADRTAHVAAQPYDLIAFDAPAGVSWEIKSMTFTVGDAAATGRVLIYVGSVDPLNLIHAASVPTGGAPVVLSTAVAQGHVVPEYTRVIVAFYLVAADGTALTTRLTFEQTVGE